VRGGLLLKIGHANAVTRLIVTGEEVQSEFLVVASGLNVMGNGRSKCNV
jgi:hypothetical protein